MASRTVSGEGFNTTVQPAASAGAYFSAEMMFGKFHGATAATTPTGTRRTKVFPPLELPRDSSVACVQIKSA
jgi:hypothetical protein